MLHVVRLLLWCCSLAGVLSAQAPADSEQRLQVGADTVAIALAHRAEKMKAALSRGDAKSIAGAVQDVEVLRRDHGTLDMTPLVESLTVWALSRGADGQVDLGLQTLRQIEHWAPGHPTLMGARISLLRQRDLMGYIEGLPDVIELSRLRLTHPVHRWLFVIHHLAWLRVLVTALTLGWALALVMRYRRVFRYLWEEPLSRFIPNAMVRALAGAFLLSLPVLVGLDPIFCAMAWLWLLVPFMQRHELRTAMLVILLQLAHPLLSLLEPKAVQVPRPSLESVQLRPHWKVIDWSSVKGLSEGDRAYLKGWQALQNQTWSEAETLFRHLVSKHPFQPGVLNNLGVAVYQLGRTEEADRLFEQANNKGTTTEILMNQSILAFRKLDSNLGAQKQDEARKSSPERYVQLRDASQARIEQRAFAVPLPDTAERIEALAHHIGEPQLPSGARWGLDAMLWTGVPLAAVALMFLRARQSLREAHPTQCIRCGEAFHTTDSPEPDVCSKCHHLFVLKDGLHGDSRKAKVEDAATFQTQQRWIHRTLIVLVPGLDLVFLGQSRAGFLEFTLVAFAASMVLGTGRLMRYPGEVLPDPVSLWLPIGYGLLGLFYFRSWLKLFLRRG